MIDREQWARVKALFHAVLELPEGEREPFLERAADGDGVVAEVRSLLRSHETAGPFLDTPAQVPSGVAEGEPLAGRRIGPYRVLRNIGSGGMGAVYLAVRDDDAYQKRVAIKVVALGALDEDARVRFRDERQILADLDHPNIVRLLDGGTTADGLPYLVMDYVEGVTIDRFVADRRLSIDDRLRLFVEVCAPVQYAHRHLVVHRDLKSGNILVTPDGTPKLLDFGIAKLLAVGDEGRAAVTATGLRMLTPECASPEQIRGERVTTASDVYALGVLLFRLLTGRSPYTARTTVEMARAVCEEIPSAPSAVADRAVARRLAGDLDTIVSKALQKDAARRYASVDELAQDVVRHLEGRPVVARPDTPGYRAVKFVKRHRAGVAAVALVAVSLVAGLIGTAFQARIARRERAVAQQRFEMVRELANTVVSEFGDALASGPESIASRKLIVVKAIEYLNSLSQQAQSDPVLLRQLASAYVRIGDIQGDPTKPNLGDVAGALSSYERALALYSQLTALGADDANAREGAAQAHRALGVHHWEQGHYDLAFDHFSEMQRLYDRLGQEDPARAIDYRSGAAGAHFRIGQVWLRRGNGRQARESYQRALSLYESLAAAVPENRSFRANVALSHLKLGDVSLDLGDIPAAQSWYRKSAASFEALTSPGARLDVRRMAAMAWMRVGDSLTGTDPAEAQVAVRRALSMLKPIADADRSNVQARADLGYAYRALGAALTDRRELPAKERALGSAIRELRSVLDTDPQHVDARRELGVSLRMLGDASVARRQFASALRSYREALPLLEAPDIKEHSHEELASLYQGLGVCHAAIRRSAPAGARGADASPATWFLRSADQWKEVAKRRPLRPAEVASEREAERSAEAAVRSAGTP